MPPNHSRKLSASLAAFPAPFRASLAPFLTPTAMAIRLKLSIEISVDAIPIISERISGLNVSPAYSSHTARTPPPRQSVPDLILVASCGPFPAKLLQSSCLPALYEGTPPNSRRLTNSFAVIVRERRFPRRPDFRLVNPRAASSSEWRYFRHYSAG